MQSFVQTIATGRVFPSVDIVKRKEQKIPWSYSDTNFIVYFRNTPFMNSYLSSMTCQLQCSNFLCSFG